MICCGKLQIDFTHMIQDYLPQCHWNNLEEYEYMDNIESTYEYYSNNK